MVDIPCDNLAIIMMIDYFFLNCTNKDGAMDYSLIKIIKNMTLNEPLKFKESNQNIKLDDYALNSPF